MVLMYGFLNRKVLYTIIVQVHSVMAVSL